MAANKIVSLLLQVKNAISPGVKEASDDLRDLNKRTTELEGSLNKFDNALEAVESLKTAGDAAQEAEKQFDDAQLQVEKLKQAFKSDKTPELGVALEKAKVAAREAKKEWQGSVRAVQKLEKVVTSAGGDLTDLAATEKKFANEVEFANGKLKAHVDRVNQVRRSLKGAGEQAVKTTSSIGGTIAKVGAFVGSLVIVDKLKDGFASLASSVFDVASEFELLGQRLSPEDLGYVTEFARTAPVEIDTLADSFAKLRAFGIDPTNGSLRSLVDQNAALGGSQETLNGLILATGQAWAKQKLQGEEILQFVERGVPVWDLLAKATGKNVTELQRMSEAGELGRREIVLLLEEMGKANSGKAAEAMNSLAGLVLSLKNDITAFYRSVSDNGALDAFKNALRDAREQIQLMADDGRLERISQGVVTLFQASIRWGREAVTALNDNFGKLVGSAQIFANSIGLVWNGLRAGVTGAVAVVSRAVAELADFAGLDEFANKARAMSTAFADAFESSSADVRANLQGIADATEKLDKSFTDLTTSAAKAGSAAEATTESVEQAGQAAAEAGQSGAESLDNLATSLGYAADEGDRAADSVAGTADETGRLVISVEQASEKLNQITGDLAGWFQSVRSEVGALSETAQAAFENRLGIDSAGPVTEIEAVKASLQAARDELAAIGRDNLQVFDVTGINRWKNSVLEAKNETVAAYNEQKLKALEYLQALQSGEGVNQAFLTNAERSLATMDMLGSQDLSTLRSALAAANNELQQIRDSAADAVSSLQDQLDRLRGNTDAIAQRDYESKRAELQAELDRAKAYGDNEAIRKYSEALRLLNEVRKEQVDQSRSDAGSSGSGRRSASRSEPAQSTRVIDTVNVNLNVGNEVIPVQGERQDVNRLVSVLQESKNRSGA